MRSVISVYLDGEAIERRSDAGRKLRSQLRVSGAVGEVREPGLACADLLCHLDGLRDAEMSRMGFAKERVDYQNGYATKCAQRFVRQLLGVGYVSQVSNPVAVNRDRTVRNRDRHHLDIPNGEALAGAHVMRPALRLARARQRLDRRVEDVGESFGQSLHRVGRTIHVDRRVTTIRKRADIIDAVDMIGVIVREQNCVDSTNIGGDELKTQLGRRVDEDVRSTVCPDQRAHAGTLVPRVR
jgi:hypothetical protein